MHGHSHGYDKYSVIIMSYLQAIEWVFDTIFVPVHSNINFLSISLFLSLTGSSEWENICECVSVVPCMVAVCDGTYLVFILPGKFTVLVTFPLAIHCLPWPCQDQSTLTIVDAGSIS